MSEQNLTLAQELMDKTLWWRYSSIAKKNALLLSPELKALFNHSIVEFKHLTGRYTTPMIQFKVKEVLESPDKDVRFITSYHTRHGKRSFQHQLHVYEEDGKRYVLANCMDVTEMVALEREIVDAQGRLSVTQVVERQELLEAQHRIVKESYQKQSRFLAMLSHELRSPLLGISSLVQRLRANQTDEAVLNALKAIHITAEQSTFLVNDILTYSQTEFDEVTLHPVAFSLKETLNNVKQLTKSIAADKGLFVSLIYLGEQDMVVGDRVRVSQVLINLIVNSIKFTQYGGVSIEVIQGENNRFSFKVTDSGEGIAEDQLERIFEPYAQLESIGSTQNIGSGLGLLVVKKLVYLMGGDISVKSTLKVGTSFYFDLVFSEDEIPKANEEREITALAATNLEEASAKNSFEQMAPVEEATEGMGASPLVLIADDSNINLMVLGGYLQELNCTVVEAKNGREAWELFLKNTFEYVFLDIQMPFLDGIEVSQKIKECVQKQCPSAKHLKKVFAVTAGGDESNFTLEGQPVESNGFDHWFVKPVSKAQIMAVLQDKTLEKDEENTHVEKISPPVLNDEKQRVSSVESDLLYTEIKYEGVEAVPEQFLSLVDNFLNDLKTGFSEMSELIQMGDASGIVKKAHYLKGNCMLLQLETMVTLLRELETLAQKNKQDMGNKQKEFHFILEKLRFGLKYLEKSIAIRHNAL